MSIYTLMPLHQSLGVAVIGVDLSAPIDDETRDNLALLLAKYLVLVFPAQSLTPEQYLAAAHTFGPPTRLHHSQHPLPGFPDIGMVGPHNGEQEAGIWRTDHTDREYPPAALILYGVEIPADGGRTSIANMQDAYWALPEAERHRLETLRTFNHRDPVRADIGDEDGAKHGAPVFHPMVRLHPVSRDRALYFHPTARVEGMTPQESRQYLTDLLERMIQPDIVYDHDWVTGDVLVIDERATLHRAQDDDDRIESRVLWRIIVEGDRPKGA